MQSLFEDLSKASNQAKPVSVPASPRLTDVVGIGNQQTHLHLRRHAAPLTRQLVAHRTLHLRKARGVDNDCSEVATLDLSPCRHDDVHMRVLRVAVNRSNPGWSPAGIPPELVHCSACQSLEVEPFGTFGGEHHAVSGARVPPRAAAFH